ncbi:MAG: peptidoglycan DD-metalloendopeptidase family protein [Acutalibacter sp.]|nr:peptidoglycan DD-metalloendopeptidase family protein [Acutalibacter sp.]
MKRINWKRWASLLLALCLLLAVPGNAIARTLEEVEAEQDELDAQKQELESRLTELRNDEAQKREYQRTLQQKIDVVQEQVDSARRDIDELNGQINVLTTKLKKSQEKIQDTIDRFKERLAALYRAGNVSTLEILLNSSSFSDFTMRSELVKAMSLRDQDMLDVIENYITETEDERAECEKSKAKVAELQKKLESDMDELNDLYAENNAAIAALQEAENATQAELDKNTAEREANDKEMEELIAKQKAWEEEQRRQQAGSFGGTYWGSGVTYPTGGGGVEGFHPIWPLPGVSYISAGYGGYPGHRGLDIAGPYGTPVVAAESGTVIKANDYDSWGDSWGYYVLVYHNGTFTTRYAHLSALTVYDGQYVEKGTVVGYEGATGNVTGPHLHFEVYENGTRVDPMRYL